MINIKMHKEKWRLVIEKEELECEDLDKLLIVLKQVCEIKEKYGRLEDREKW